MGAFPFQSPRSEACVDALINEYFDHRRAGEARSLRSFAAEHPDLAEEFLPCVEGASFLEGMRPLAGLIAGLGDAREGSAALLAVAGYEVLEEIGRGGMGVVYKAVQTSTKRTVALKVMSAGPFAPRSALQRFDREVELAARLRHPGIVRILDSGHVARQKYYAMDLIEGVRFDRCAASAQHDVRTMLGIAQRICEAVEYAHNHGVIHRDLKPANVLVDNEGDPHILDFGLAKATDQAGTDETATTCVSVPGQVLGTLFYLSPEQAVGSPDEIDTRTDVYGLGVMLFEALTGSLPFDTTGRPSQVIQRIVDTPPTRPSLLSDRVDDEVETILLRAMEKDKACRYQSAVEMAEDIHRYLEGEPILAKRPSSFYFLRKKLRKYRFRLSLGVMVVALGLAGPLAASWSRQGDLARAHQTARRALVHCQQDLESGAPGSGAVLGRARALYEQHPELPESRLVLAHANYRSEWPFQAIVGLLDSLRSKHPSRWACRALLAEIYRETGNAEEADELQKQAEREMPDTSEAWYIRSYATIQLDRALRYAQEAVKRQPSHVLAWSRLAHLQQQTGDSDGALESADKLIELGNNPTWWASYKGHILDAQGRLQEAIDLYSQYDMYSYRARVYQRLGQYDKALADYDKATQSVRHETTAVWNLYQRATPLWILGRTEDALKDYQRVRNLRGRPSYADARRFLILRELDRQREAKQVLDAALRDVAVGRDAKDTWLRQIFFCLDGQLTPNELVADAIERDNLEWLCEAYYYAGEVCHLLLRRPADARKWFEKCVQTNLQVDPDTELGTPMNEYELAQWRLESLPTRIAIALHEEN